MRRRRPTQHTDAVSAAADKLLGIPLEESLLMAQRMRWALGPGAMPPLTPLAPVTGKVVDHEINHTAGVDIPLQDRPL